MSRRLLLQSILKFREGIKSGAAKVQDIVEDYFKSSGKSVTDEDRAIIMNEFAESAPSNVTTLEGVDPRETIMPMGGVRGPNVQKAGEMSDTPVTDKIMKDQGIESLRGDETFGELLEKMGPADDTPSFIKDFDKNLDRLAFSRFNKAYKDLEVDEKDTILASMRKVGDEVFGTSTVPDPIKDFDKNLDRLALSRFNKTYKELDVDEKDSILATMKKIGNEVFGTKEEGIGSLFPKGKPGEIFDVDNSRREEVATFIKDMRKAGIKNKDIKDTFKLTGTDIEQGKRAATSLARAADMGADTKGKQELLSEFDEMKMDKGPRFFQEEYMGYDSFSDAIRAKASEINNAIVDDLDKLGVDDETVTRIVSSAREVMNRNPFAGPDEMLASIKQDLELENIKYDVTFFENLLNEYRKLMRKPEPRFEYGGMV